MESGSFLLGMAQIRVEGGALAANVERARQALYQAAELGCRIVVLPECLDVGWAHPAAHELAQPLPGATSEKLAEAAREMGLYVVAGLTERSGDRLYNAAILLSPNGEILLKHRKINVLVEVEGLYSPGDRLGVAETPLGTIAVNICADNFPNSLALAHAQARMGAQMLLSPSAWAVDADYDNAREPYGGLWKDAYTSLAELYDLHVVGVSNVGRVNGGPWEGRHCIGCSLAVGPSGQLLAEGPFGESAEAVIPVQITIRHPAAQGTGFAPMLSRRGYKGP